jgi:protein-S-isoprenylcysteine O-methyltransferase Ste14
MGQSRLNWAALVMSGLPPVATGRADFPVRQLHAWNSPYEVYDRNAIISSMIISPLARRAVTGLCWLVAIMAGLLGLSAGSPCYWAGWAFLATFLLCIACITADLLRRAPALVERRMRSGPTAEKESTQKVIQSITGAAFIGFLVVAGLDFRFGWSAVPLGTVILGHVLTILSFAGIYLVFRENAFASSTIETAADQRLVDTGPYAIIRHPSTRLHCLYLSGCRSLSDLIGRCFSRYL